MTTVRAEQIGALLRDEASLASIIRGALGLRPELEVVWQHRVTAPVPWWAGADEALASVRGDMLMRCTGYRAGGLALSHHLAWVTLESIDPALAESIERGETNLGEVFEAVPVEKRAVHFGDEGYPEAQPFVRCMLEGASVTTGCARADDGAPMGDLARFQWRRYVATLDSVPAFVVFEALPTATWELLLSSWPRPRSMKGASGG